MLAPQEPFVAMQLNNLFRELWDLTWTCTDSIFLFASKFLNILSSWRPDGKAQSGHRFSFFTVQLIKRSLLIIF